jgi:hypothetical protein
MKCKCGFTCRNAGCSGTDFICKRCYAKDLAAAELAKIIEQMRAAKITGGFGMSTFVDDLAAILSAAERTAAAEAEAFRLAAITCDYPAGDAGGRKYCTKITDLESKLAAAVARADKAEATAASDCLQIIALRGALDITHNRADRAESALLALGCRISPEGKWQKKGKIEWPQCVNCGEEDGKGSPTGGHFSAPFPCCDSCDHLQWLDIPLPSTNGAAAGEEEWK